MKRSFIREILSSIDKETISFAGGLPDENLFPLTTLQQSAIHTFENAHNLQYAMSEGIPSLREKIAMFYTQDGFDTTRENILITNGSQQALYIVATYFNQQSIVIETPSYLGAMGAFNANHMKLKQVPLYNDGIDIEKFLFNFRQSRLAYLIPDFQNPTSAYYSLEKREHLAALVQKIGGYIIEDAPYSDLYFEYKAPSISASIPENSFHLGSFSKTLSPAFRIGWIRADKTLIQKLLPIKESIDLHTSSISQHIIDRYLESPGEYRDHLKQLRTHYKVKMDFFAQTLHRSLPRFDFTTPLGGMFIYGSLENIDTYTLVQSCLKNKVAFVPGNQFYARQAINNEIRFNFTHASPEDITKGIQRIAEVINQDQTPIVTP